MQNWSHKTIISGLSSALNKAARNPYGTFFLLFAAAIAIAAYVFFSLQDLVLPYEAAVPKNKEFTAETAAEYRRVFEIINRRREKYAQDGISVDPGIFGINGATLPVLAPPDEAVDIDLNESAIQTATSSED